MLGMLEAAKHVAEVAKDARSRRNSEADGHSVVEGHVHVLALRLGLQLRLPLGQLTGGRVVQDVIVHGASRLGFIRCRNWLVFISGRWRLYVIDLLWP